MTQSTAKYKLDLTKHFKDRVKIRESVQPVQQRLLFSVRQDFTPEIQRLLEMDATERTDASPWVSPIVVKQRKMLR